jgi:DNA polymerase kappa
MDSPEPKESVDETEAELDSNRDAHSSLKHQLLGPSLTKAGQDSVDQRKVSYSIQHQYIGKLKVSRFQKLYTTRPRVLNSLTMKRPEIVV